MAFARDSYTASASQTDFTITFPYLAEDDVNVYKDGVLMTNQADADTVSYQIVSTTIVRFGAGLTGGEIVLITRTTSQSVRLVDYTTASTLTEEDLDNDSLQAFYMAQEAIDTAGTALGLGSDDNWDAESKLIKNVTDPAAAQDAATKNYVDTVLTTLGNIPVPSASKDLLVATGATAGDYAWATALDTATQIANDLIDSQHYAAASIDNEHLADNAVNTDEIADNAVTLAKMAGGTDGNLITYDASGDPAFVTTGSSGQVLTSNGAGAAPTFQSNSANWSAWTVFDATNSGANDLTDVPVTGLSSVSEIQILFDNISTSGTNEIELELGDSGGLETSGYAGGVKNDGSGVTSGTHGDSFKLQASTVAASLYNGLVRLYNVTGNEWHLMSHLINSAGSVNHIAAGQKTLTASLTQFNLTTDGGTDTFDSGNIYYRTR